MKNFLAISFSIACLIALFIWGCLHLEQKLENWMEERIAQELLQQTENVAIVLRETKTKPEISVMQKLIERLEYKSGYRVTILNQDGTVLADSDLTVQSVKTVENHANRPEITSATKKTPGIAKRFSKTVKADFLYLAVPYNGDWNGYIRVAISLNTVKQYLSELYKIQIYIGVAIVLIVLSIASIIVFTISRLNKIHKSELEDKIQQRTDTLVKLKKMGQLFSTANNIEELAEMISVSVESLFPNTSGALSVIHPSMDENEVIKTWGAHWTGQKKFSPQECWAFRRGKTHIFDRDTLNISCKHLNSKSTSICSPLVAHGTAVGTLHILADDFPINNIAPMFATLSDYVALALANLNLREKLRNQAVRDPLTNLYNRRYLEEFLQKELQKAKRHNTSFGIMMMDVDYFKKFNDTFGHDAGDYVLQALAKAMYKNIRLEDIPCRYGGEEFMIILVDADQDVITHRAQLLLESVRKMELVYNNRSLGHITLSIGIAIYPFDGTTAEALIRSADNSLYQAKQNGRNQVWLSTTNLMFLPKVINSTNS